MSSTDSGGTRAARGIRSPLTLSDLLADLEWPRLLRAPALGFNGGRLVLAFLAMAASAVMLSAGLWLDEQVKEDSTEVRWVQVQSEVSDPELYLSSRRAHAASAPWRYAVRYPVQLARKFPFTTVVFGPLVLAAWAVCLGGICRTAACEFAQGVMLPWPQGLAFGVSRWRSLVGAVVLPLALVWVIAVGTAAASAVLLRAPVVNLVGSVLFGLMLAASLLAVMVLLGYVLGKSLLIPSVACEGTDAIDAVQRVYAYVIGRPLRVVAYLAILAATVLVAGAVAAGVAAATIGFAMEGAMAWNGEAGGTSVWAAATAVLDGSARAETAGTFAAASRVIRLWLYLPVVLAACYAVSTAASGATVMYLLLRRINDGQDVSEIWMPGMTPGTMASARGAAPASAAVPDEVEGTTE
jgi:hypothetical protein